MWPPSFAAAQIIRSDAQIENPPNKISAGPDRRKFRLTDLWGNWGKIDKRVVFYEAINGVARLFLKKNLNKKGLSSDRGTRLRRPVLRSDTAEGGVWRTSRSRLQRAVAVGARGDGV
jgi:hypothetical protein